MIAAQESMTAKLCSFARAYHSMLGKNKIFDDYLAYDIIGKDEYDEIGGLLKGQVESEGKLPRYGFESLQVFDEMDHYFSPIALSRIAFAERALRRFARRRSECQYVICGAGMDTFAFRNTDEAIEVFELDHPDTQAYKLRRIHKLHWDVPRNTHYAAIDFEQDDLGKTLLHSGFRPYESSFFSLLGVSYYLTPEAFREFVRSISLLSSPGSQFVLDFPDDSTFKAETGSRVHRLAEITRRLGEPMRHGFSLDEMRGILAEEGFVIRTHESPEDIQRHFFADRTDQQRAMENIHFILAEKRQH
ncbi:putative methyltransferase [Selenomonas ruminantium subsp. lactilytica TAM6421]|uniref:S-adenosyl-L-methionine-dependent methyltransferase n=1 Tax=Selenomonas ruminantium subsp. lactilytica (strain NBRC 103574 / TAM6421) TaxID=927704 RepID=I0GUQ6_SELRL|nr:SAM-dependent methyltransferase [Selenomonas ruminantium]BAL84493.1 putative methyltransferase [Selenomonas ruminantium subsp. lactilytica TAM6421]